MIVEEWLGKDNKIGIDIWNKKYRQNNESFDEWLDRVSGSNKSIRKLIKDKKFLFGGRILAGRGISENGRKVSLSNCYVIKSPEDNLESIFECAKNMARTYSYGGGCGTDLSKLSPRGAIVRNAAKTTSGAVSFMDLFSTTTASVCQEGRRGALMLTLNCDHPDIEEFLDVKKDLTKVTKANTSVKFNDIFMDCAKRGNKMDIHFTREATGEEIIKEISPRTILEKLAENNWEMAEPGALFWDRIKDWNLQSTNKDYIIESTNPCGEQPLPEFGSCLLGSLNLAAFVECGIFRTDDFIEAIWDCIRGLNEVLDEGIELHPLQAQRDIARDWRNCGLGIMGLADCLIKMGLTYGSKEAVKFCHDIADLMIYEATEASCFLAEEQGMYPKCDPNLIIESEFFKNYADDNLAVEVAEYGLRNCSLLTIAPTGTLSTMLGVSGGIEPIFANSYTRKTESLNGNEEPVYYKVYTPVVKDYMEQHECSEENLPEFFVTAHQISYHDRIKMQAAWQEFIDASISSTINLPNETSKDDIYNLYLEAWEAGLKGCTVYRDGCARTGILTTSETKAEEKSDGIERGFIYPTSDNIIGLKKKLTTGCGSLHCEAFFDMESGEFRECFLSKGSTGGCSSFMIGLSRMISIAARGGVKLEDILDQLNSVSACPSYAARTASKHDTSKGSSCPATVGYALKEMNEQFQKLYFHKEELIKPIPAKDSAKCPECGADLVFEGGCNVCKECGWSKCS